MSGQFSEQIRNLAGTSLFGMPQQQNIMHSSGGSHNTYIMEPDFLKARQFIQERIYDLMRRQQTQAVAPEKVMDIVRRLDEGLLKTATTEEEYMNLDTLETRLRILNKKLQLSNQNQQYHQQGNTSVPMGTMIPNPSMPQSGNSSIMVSSETYKGSLGSSDGGLTNGYQHSKSSYPNNPGGHSLISSMGAQRMSSQMIPTPGFYNSNSTSNQSCMNMVSPDSVVGPPTIDSTMASQPLQQKQQVGGQNSRIFHNLVSHLGAKISSSIHQRAHGFPNGTINSGLGNLGNNLPPVNGPGTSESYVTACHYAKSHRTLPQHFNQQMSQGDGYVHSTDSGEKFVPTASVTSMKNNQNINPVSFNVLHKANSPLLVNQSNLVTSQQAPNIKSSVNRSQKMDIRSQHSLHKSAVQSQQPVHIQQQFLPSQSKKQNLISDQFESSKTANHFQGNSQEDQFVGDAQNDLSWPVGTQPGSGMQGQRHSRSQEVLHMTSHVSGHNVQEEFSRRIVCQDQAQKNNLSSKGSITNQSGANRSVDPPNSGAICKSTDSKREWQVTFQQRWLIFLRHASNCVPLTGKCSEIYCITAKQLLSHMVSCNNRVQCQYPRCRMTTRLFCHTKHCRDLRCPVCAPVKRYWQRKGASSEHHCGGTGKHTMQRSPSVFETSEDLYPTLKKIKIEPSSESLAPESENPSILVPVTSASELQNEIVDTHTPTKSEVIGVKLEIPTSSVHESPKKDYMEGSENQKSVGAPVLPNNVNGFPKLEVVKTEKEVIKTEKEVVKTEKEVVKTEKEVVKTEKEVVKSEKEVIKTEKEVGQQKLENPALPAETATGTKSGKADIKGVSMIELFTPEQVREHISGLRQWVGQSKTKVEKNQALKHSMSENSCQLCAVERLSFEPPPIYCTPCGARIKRNAMFYTAGTGDTLHYICVSCYSDVRGDTISVDGTDISKARLEKKKNDEETEEWWVQCDKCEAWQHQICALFNGKRNDGGEAEYTCPNCYIEEVERGERKPLPQSAVLGAKDLPRTILSDHIENRLFAKLKQERLDRATFHGKSYDEVPGAEALVVRVVSSVDKKLEVKQCFLEIFQDENYPVEFGYKSKVVLLFQKIEGVEVCLFGMYVQEFGADCEQPNHRRVYLSYLDSVKYFRPEIRTVTGEALRTFVYHEILIGYLEYCKLRGFTSCYIWACPPLKGEDYILYCHPEIQKTPKSDKLREWYLSMLRKATKENIVVDLTNLYDHFFVSSGECKAKVTAARLPYFDGDYWPGAAEDIIDRFHHEEEGRKQNKKGSLKKTMTKRAMKASGQTDLSGNLSKDLLLMNRLGDSISPMKEDFIMVHFQHSCTRCCMLMVSGKRWVCSQCKKFQLCDKCYEIEQKLEDRERHPINHREKHPLYPIEINDVSEDTKDKDEILESEFFDTRQAFLSLCQGNHYQYETLRRAKHSSMMVLYHLHNPTAPAFVTTCNRCHLDIETGQGWRCDVCPDFDVCNNCYYKEGGIDHPHKLTHHPSIAERDAQNKEARQQRVVQLRKMLDLLIHASQCRSPLCQYHNCRKVKGLFRHGTQCKLRASGGCLLCKRMWYMLHLHSRACKDSQCTVPRCRDLKVHSRRLQQQSDSRRRAAVMEMMRQRAAEVGCSRS
uniref:histone acetyltransferase HAC1-like isoform X2 n=1 Tax=Erigeron canadensis TaxID=72917 RepID=UPI001CB97BE5|nr:histone acetyltransferase HAC1-like isoform X2 [Erigeron canadensis]